ncbi:citrate synthase [Aquibacillus koreensis]|uniref:Citrate synthase n=1 Tax=Aquibacillus koreensis TaxID=279446 RepID=A0A9X4AH19_9BACI|nr:citrate synthase [Aquibacillus koreensis]MCT2537184.1 citrate synthase [Aquibacillus koreensis]MDC3419244.1 citrate synthase [Aquibacillus koreensis]
MSTTKGLEGVIATESSISSIIDDQLTYVGFTIDDLAENSSFEEVVFLLWNKRLPNSEELKEIKSQLNQNMELPKEVIDHFKSYDLKTVHPMAALRTAVSLLGLFDSEADEMDPSANLRKAVRLQAKIASVVTAFARIREGKEPISPKSDYSYAANFLYMLNGKEPEAIEVEAINKALVLHADHELNASTFTSRVCVATLSDVYSGITAAIGALKGPLHGGANERVMKMLTEIGEVDNAIPYIKEKMANKEKIMGMGHRVYRKGDPRAKHLKKMSKELTELTGQSKWYEMSVKIEDYIKAEKGLPANVDFYSASVYHSLGIDHDLFTPIFAMSRFSGWLAHMLEQYDNNRLIRPRAEYVGPKNQYYVPVEER